RCAGRALRRPGLGDQFLPSRKSNAKLCGHPALHRTGDARRYLALRRQSDRATLLARRALRHRATQRGRDRIRLRGPNICHPARPRPAAGKLAAPLYARARRQGAGICSKPAYNFRGPFVYLASSITALLSEIVAVSTAGRNGGIGFPLASVLPPKTVVDTESFT